MVLAACVDTGTNATGGRCGQSPTKPSGATPMTVYLMAPMWSVDPIASSRAPYRLRHIAWLSTATGVPTGGASRAGAPGTEVFAWAVRTDAGDWHRAAGFEARVYEGANGFARLPGASVTAGAAWLFDPPNADRVRVWAAVSYRP
jgi:hypothetical protein